MLDVRQIGEIAKDIAANYLVEDGLERVVADTAVDSSGNDALRITMVLSEAAAKAIDGEHAVDLLVALKAKLGERGESRFPIIEYATEAELVDSDSDVGD